MGPKKNKLTTSTTAVVNPSMALTGAADTSGPSAIDESSFVIGNVENVVLKEPAVEKVKTLDLICKAIETVGVPKKGASYIAIKKWIVDNQENVESNRLRANMKKAIVKALESGLLKRPATSKNATGLRGYFLINKDIKDAPKNAPTKTPNTLIEKTKVSKITKLKTTTAPKTKAAVNPKSNIEEATGVNPKTKAAKTKIVKSKSDAESESNDKTKPKAKSAVKSNPGKVDGPKLKTKATVGKSMPENEDLPIKPKLVKSRGNGIKVSVQELDSEEVPKKVPKAAPKTTKNAKEPRSRKLHSSRDNPVTNMSRKDLSDTELNVKPDNRKSMKSYSSDTELEVVKRSKATKVARYTKTKITGRRKLQDFSEAGPSKGKQKSKNTTYEVSD